VSKARGGSPGSPAAPRDCASPVSPGDTHPRLERVLATPPGTDFPRYSGEAYQRPVRAPELISHASGEYKRTSGIAPSILYSPQA
jgi:hypothetical protein